LCPIEFGGLYADPFRAALGAVAASLVAAGVAVYAAFTGPAMPRHMQQIIPFVKVAVGMYVAMGVPNPAEIISGSGVIILALLLPLRPSGSIQSGGRAFLALSAALHTGIAYPVAGSQIAWSSFLLIAASYVCLWDGLSELRALVAAMPASNRIVVTGLVCLGLASYHGSRTPVAALEGRVQNLHPLPFKGATSIRRTMRNRRRPSSGCRPPHTLARCVQPGWRRRLDRPAGNGTSSYRLHHGTQAGDQSRRL
jgi:hypothetical protein